MFIPKRLRSFISLPYMSMVPGEDDGGGSSGGGTDDPANKSKTDDPGKEGGGKSGSDDSDKIDRAEFDRVKSDMHKFKKAAEKAAQEKKDAETVRMRDQNQHKELADKYEKEAKEANEKAERMQNSYINDRKYNAVRSKCEALGIRPEALSDLENLDLEDIQIETTSTGKVNVLNAEKFATALKTRKPHWFSDKTPPKVNTNGTRVLDSNDPITATDLLAAEAEGKKSGNLSKYHELYKKFQQQRVANNRR